MVGPASTITLAQGVHQSIQKLHSAASNSIKLLKLKDSLKELDSLMEMANSAELKKHQDPNEWIEITNELNRFYTAYEDLLPRYAKKTLLQRVFGYAEIKREVDRVREYLGRAIEKIEAQDREGRAAGWEVESEEIIKKFREMCNGLTDEKEYTLKAYLVDYTITSMLEIVDSGTVSPSDDKQRVADKITAQHNYDSSTCAKSKKTNGAPVRFQNGKPASPRTGSTAERIACDFVEGIVEVESSASDDDGRHPFYVAVSIDWFNDYRPRAVWLTTTGLKRAPRTFKS